MPGICDGRVVIVTGDDTSSPAGLYTSRGQTNYGPAKAGIAHMTIILAGELARYGVTVNAISPGARTRMTDTWHAGAQADKGSRWDPAVLGPIVHDLVAKARPKVGLFGQTEQAPAPAAEVR